MKIIESVHHITLSAFIECAVDQNYSVLTIEGEPTPEQLLNAWHKIYAEYLEVLEDAKTKMLIDAMQEAAYNRNKLTGCRAAVSVLRYRYHQGSVDTLKEFGFTFNPSQTDAEDYSKKLDAIELRFKSIEVAIKNYESQITDIFKNQSGEAPSRIHFYDMIGAMSKFYGHAIDPETMNAGQFARNLKQMNDFALKSAQNDRTP